MPSICILDMLQTKQDQCQDQEKPTKRCQYLHVALRLLCNLHRQVTKNKRCYRERAQEKTHFI